MASKKKISKKTKKKTLPEKKETKKPVKAIIAEPKDMTPSLEIK